MLTVTERFARWLTLSGFSQAELAAELGHHRSFITRIKTGEKRPTLNDAVKLEAMTGIPASAWAATSRVSGVSETRARGRKARVA